MRPHISTRLTGSVTLLIAALAALLLALASSASATVSPPTITPNPGLQPSCGTKVVLVLDESGSIGSTAGAEQAVRDAANAFADGLADTGSELAVIEFGSSAKRVFGYTPVTAGPSGTLQTTFRPYFDGTATPPADVYNSPSQLGQWTNWQDALDEVAALNTESGVAPLVVFVTDGDPTAINTANGVQTNVASATAVIPAITSANAVKTQGSHILAVGVGAALNNAASLTRLTQISGPDVATDPAAVDLQTTDVLRIADFSTLPAALRSVVSQLCKATVSVTKSVDKPVVLAGTEVTWTVNLKNTGDVALANVTVDDAVAPGCNKVIPVLAVNESATITCTSTVAQDTTNTAVVTALDPLERPVGPVSATASVDVIAPAIGVTKAVDRSTVEKGSTVTYTITVTNTGDAALSNVSVSDPSTPACDHVIGQLAAGASTSYTCTATINADTTNVAIASGTDPLGNTLTKSANTSVTVTTGGVIGGQQTTLSIDKRGPSTAQSGAVIAYTIKIKNTGAVTAENVVMRDKIPTSLSLVKRPAGVQLSKGVIVVKIGTLAPGASKTIKLQFRIDRRASGVQTNTASASASNARTVRDSAKTRIVLVGGSLVIPGVTG